MMEKMIISKHGRVIDLDNIDDIFRKTVMIMDDDEKQISPFAVFAVMKTVKSSISATSSTTMLQKLSRFYSIFSQEITSISSM